MGKKKRSLSDQVARLEKLKQYAFGTDKWVKYFGDLVGNIPPLPDDIYEICNGDDHLIPGEKITDTHVLVLVPKTVAINRKQINITLKSLGEIVKTPKNGGHSTGYDALICHGHETHLSQNRIGH